VDLSRLRGIVAARSWRGDVQVAGGARIGRGVRIVVAPGGRLRVGRGCRLGDGCRLVVCSGGIELGAGSVLGDQCTLIARREITIGARSRLGDGASILDFGPAPTDSERPIRLQPLHEAAVVLGEDVVVGVRAAIGPGVRLPAAGRVGAGVVLGAITAPLLALAEPAPAAAPAPAGAERRPVSGDGAVGADNSGAVGADNGGAVGADNSGAVGTDDGGAVGADDRGAARGDA
jgi:acetyltransferase-like isoleucine patch superfamily enzyme